MVNRCMLYVFFLCVGQNAIAADAAQKVARFRLMHFEYDIEHIVKDREQDATALEALLQKGKQDGYDIPAVLNKKRDIPFLLSAVSSNATPCKMKVLIDYRADVNVRSRYQMTALMEASCKTVVHSCDKARLLIESNAEVNAQGAWKVRALNRLLEVALHRTNHIQLLIDSRADVNSGTPLPLIAASKQAEVSTMRCLMHAGAVVVNNDMRDALQEIIQDDTVDDACRELLRCFLAGEPIPEAPEETLHGVLCSVDQTLGERPFQIIWSYCGEKDGIIRWNPWVQHSANRQVKQLLCESANDLDDEQDEKDAVDEAGLQDAMRALAPESEEYDIDEYDITLTIDDKVHSVSQQPLLPSSMISGIQSAPE